MGEKLFIKACTTTTMVDVLCAIFASIASEHASKKFYEVTHKICGEGTFAKSYRDELTTEEKLTLVTTMSQYLAPMSTILLGGSSSTTKEEIKRACKVISSRTPKHGAYKRISKGDEHMAIAGIVLYFLDLVPSYKVKSKKMTEALLDLEKPGYDATMSCLLKLLRICGLAMCGNKNSNLSIYDKNDTHSPNDIMAKWKNVLITIMDAVKILVRRSQLSRSAKRAKSGNADECLLIVNNALATILGDYKSAVKSGKGSSAKTMIRVISKCDVASISKSSYTLHANATSSKTKIAITDDTIKKFFEHPYRYGFDDEKINTILTELNNSVAQFVAPSKKKSKHDSSDSDSDSGSDSDSSGSDSDSNSDTDSSSDSDSDNGKKRRKGKKKVVAVTVKIGNKNKKKSRHADSSSDESDDGKKKGHKKKSGRHGKHSRRGGAGLGRTCKLSK